jgi:hypothetical protein
MQTITKVYQNYEDALHAVRELEGIGIPTSDISLLVSKDVIPGYDQTQSDEDINNESEAGPGAGMGAVIGGAAGLLTGLGLLTIPGLGPVVAAGWLATTALGAVAGGAAGGIIGSLIDAGVPEDHAHVYTEAVRRGGTMVTVKTQDKNTPQVQKVLSNFMPIDPVERAATYRQTGWTEFDPEAGPYESTRKAADRIRRVG